MIYVVALAVLCVPVFIVTALVAVIDRQRREHARERTLLIAQLLHATGNTWTPPPERDRTDPPESRTWQASPEQHLP